MGDAEPSPDRNRAILRRTLKLPAEPLWLRQTHSSAVLQAPAAGTQEGNRQADAVCAREPGTVCAVLTADCVPVLLCHGSGTAIAAVHAGWRGLCAGIIDNTLAACPGSPGEWQAWIGPHICARHYEVGSEVREACLGRYPGSAAAFTVNPAGRWQFSLRCIIVMVLRSHGVSAISDAGHCTFGEAGRFYSHRRDGQTGRMASLIWME